MTYKGYRINRGAKNRFGVQAFLAIRGNLALMDGTEKALQARIDARERFDERIGEPSTRRIRTS